MTFKVGDTVECIDDGKMVRLKNGDHYTVKSADNPYIYFNEIEGGFLQRRFKLAEARGLDGSEYDDIMLGQDIYDKMEG